MRCAASRVALVALTASAPLSPGGAPADRGAPFRPPGIAAHLRALAAAAAAGGGTRAAGTPGYDASADYVERQLRAAGLRVVRQRVTFPVFKLVRAPRLTGAPGARVLQYSGAGSVTGPLRRVGAACDPASAALVRAGDVVLAERGRCSLRAPVDALARAGAAAVVLYDPHNPRWLGTLERPGVTIPALAVPAAVAARLPATVELSVDVVNEERYADTILGETTHGAATRVVMAGAHLDSVEAGPGLNDDGSGVAAVLDTAQRLAHAPARARLRVAFWAAEEPSPYLLGSTRYVRSLTAAERHAIKTYINLDMVGSPHPRPAVYRAERGDATAARVERLLRRALRRPGSHVATEPSDKPSDYRPFALAGVPVGGLFTGADAHTDPCYHRACDTLRNVDVPMARRMAAALRSTLTALRG